MGDGFITWVLAVLESASLGKHLAPRVSRWYERRRYRRAFEEADTAFLDDPEAQFLARPCADEHMAREMFRLRNYFFTEATEMTEDALLQRFRQCPQAFHAVMRVSHEQTVSLEGYYVFLPITDSCVEAISHGYIEAGRHIRPTDIATQGHTVRAGYISVVCGKGPRAQLATVNALIAHIDKMRRQGGLRLIFVRPTTFEGLFALRRHAGAEFTGDGRIQRVDLSTRKPSMSFPRRKLIRNQALLHT